jgi:8-oxo-dGTP pyrophosphatase MutT (NUDIX family)
VRREFSAGGVVFQGGEPGPQVLLIKDAYGRWSLAKGVVDQGETPEEAALREIQEETGLEGEIEESLGETHYFYTGRDGQVVSKTVRYFLVRARGGEVKPLLSEIRSACWFGPEEALKVSSYPSNTEVLRKAMAFLLDPVRSGARFVGLSPGPCRGWP